jgi:hypothetical protein
MVRDDVKRATLEAWESMAPGWERRRAEIEATSTPVREWLVKELEPRTGDTILELAAGPGDTGFEAAALVGEGGLVISTDLALRWSRSPAAGAPSSASGTSSIAYWTRSTSISPTTPSMESSAASASC